MINNLAKKQLSNKSRYLGTIILVFASQMLQYTSVKAANKPLQDSTSIQEIILQIQKKFTPDKRTAIFNLKTRFNEAGKIVVYGKTNLKEAYLELISSLNNYKTEIIDSIKILPDKNLKDKIYGITNISVANLRVKPSHSAEMGTQTLLGMPVRILEKKNDWYLVQTPDHYIAWVDDGGIETFDKSGMNDWTNSEKIVFWKQFGHSYEKPDDTSQTVSDLVICNTLKYLSLSGNYVKVAYPDGRLAYVKRSECIDYNTWLDKGKPERKSLIATAMEFMGIPYLWGGTSAKALDCSGFTKTVYLIHGYIIQRDASQQVKYGKKINTDSDYNSIQPGDLLFFGKIGENNKESVTHVGLYLGNLEYIHASGKVSINSFNKTSPIFSNYRAKSLIRACNYIDSTDDKGIIRLKDAEFYKEIK
jgi:hypothetical protein